MSGGRRLAKQVGGRPLDEGVRRQRPQGGNEVFDRHTSLPQNASQGTNLQFRAYRDDAAFFAAARDDVTA